MELDAEFGSSGLPLTMPADAFLPRLKGQLLQSTTLAVVATDATLSRVEALRVAVMAQTGFARAIYPVHAPLDGDLVFVLSTGARPLGDPVIALSRLGAYAANTLARAVARAVFEAVPWPGDDPGPPAYRTRFAIGSR
jgi:L-aminopeptidase/D-esterase-like protein